MTCKIFTYRTTGTDCCTSTCIYYTHYSNTLQSKGFLPCLVVSVNMFEKCKYSMCEDEESRKKESKQEIKQVVVYRLVLCAYLQLNLYLSNRMCTK